MGGWVGMCTRRYVHAHLPAYFLCLAAAWAQATSLAFVAAAEVMAMGTPVTSPSHPTAAMMTSTSK